MKMLMLFKASEAMLTVTATPSAALPQPAPINNILAIHMTIQTVV